MVKRASATEDSSSGGDHAPPELLEDFLRATELYDRIPPLSPQDYLAASRREKRKGGAGENQDAKRSRKPFPGDHAHRANVRAWAASLLETLGWEQAHQLIVELSPCGVLCMAFYLRQYGIGYGRTIILALLRRLQDPKSDKERLSRLGLSLPKKYAFAPTEDMPTAYRKNKTKRLKRLLVDHPRAAPLLSIPLVLGLLEAEAQAFAATTGSAAAASLRAKAVRFAAVAAVAVLATVLVVATAAYVGPTAARSAPPASSPTSELSLTPASEVAQEVNLLGQVEVAPAVPNDGRGGAPDPPSSFAFPGTLAKVAPLTRSTVLECTSALQAGMEAISRRAMDCMAAPDLPNGSVTRRFDGSFGGTALSLVARHPGGPMVFHARSCPVLGAQALGPTREGRLTCVRATKGAVLFDLSVDMVLASSAVSMETPAVLENAILCSEQGRSQNDVVSYLIPTSDSLPASVGVEVRGDRNVSLYVGRASRFVLRGGGVAFLRSDPQARKMTGKIGNSHVYTDFPCSGLRTDFPEDKVWATPLPITPETRSNPMVMLAPR